ncbi:Conserved_hypothetical protein [Hexamita inflata]|uniref:Uncharacterized protein n=1 Tax=Hexamita inflata TaxID=28002 RepID=A0AA86PYK0_9EUKA|nr:Conserved hypothetical protein [Hexamita inflata]
MRTSGFAGNDNTICVDCLRVGKFVSGTAGSTSCASCSGTQVLQAGACAECPTDFVPSADKLSCVSCMSLYGPGSSYSSANTCVCQVSSGFGGADNSICEDCKRSGKEASNTGCAACTGAQVLQSGTCQDCPTGSVQSADKLSCVIQSTCSALYGPGSLEVTPGTCRCSASGFAGNDNTVCVDCLRIGKVVSGTTGSTTCEPCSGTQVLQAGACAECPANFVPSSDKLSCISCSQRYGDGSSYSAVGTCVCDSSNGFTAASSNSACTDCWRQGKAVSGNTCASCTSPLVLQQGACSQCSNDLVPSADGLSCVTCSSRYGSGSAFESFGNCRCSASGFAGNDNTICVDCLRVGKFVSGAAGSTSCASCSGTQVLQAGACADCPANLVQSADKLSCVTCASLYGPGSSYSSANTCVCQVSAGFGGADNSICEDCKRSGKEASVTGCTACSASDVLQSGTCKACPAGSVQSLDKLSCIAQSTCQINFGPGSYEVAAGTCRCQSSSGFAGSDNQVCVDCIRIGQFVSGTAGSTACAPCAGTQVLQTGACAECPTNFVPSSDKLSCVACSTKYGYGSTFVTQNQCKCNIDGFAGEDNSVCVDCWRLGKVVSGSQCVSCPPPQIFQQGTCQDVAVAVTCPGTEVFLGGKCQECPANYVPSLDKSTCVTCSSKFEYGSKYTSVGTCKCAQELGFYGADNNFCQDCWRNSQIIGQSGCTSCPSDRKFDPSTHTCESVTTFVSQNQSGWKLGLAILSVIIFLLIIGLVIWCLRMKKRFGQPRASSKLKKVTPMKATTLLNHSGFENDLKLQQLQSLASNKFDGAKSKQDLEKQKQLERETKLQQSAEFKRLQQQKKDQESAEALKRKRETEQLKLSLQNQRLQQKLEAENAKRQNEERIRQLKMDQENSLKLQRQEQLRQIEIDKINKQKQLDEEQFRKQRELEQEQLKMQKQIEEDANRKLESERLEKERLLKLQESLLNSKRSNFGSRIMNDRSGLDVVEIAWSERHKMKPQHLVKEVKLEPMNSGIKK